MKKKEDRSFIPEFLGSAITVNLDARSEGAGFTTGNRGAPWGMKPSLKAMADEVGVDFDRLLEGISAHRSDEEIASEFNVTPKTIGYLRDHFMRFGIDSVAGQD